MKSAGLPSDVEIYPPAFGTLGSHRALPDIRMQQGTIAVGAPKSKLLVAARAEFILLLKGILDLHGFQTIMATDLATVESIAREERPTAIVFDESVSVRSDHASVSSILANLSQFAPILVLETDLGICADLRAAPAQKAMDVLRTPWAPEELIFRLASLLRKSAEQETESLSFAGVTIDLQRRLIYRNGRRVDVTPIEFHLLEHFMRHPRKVFSREDLHKAAWPKNIFVELRTVDVHVGKLRRALCAAGEPNLIRTVRTCGYALDADL